MTLEYKRGDSSWQPSPPSRTFANVGAEMDELSSYGQVEVTFTRRFDGLVQRWRNARVTSIVVELTDADIADLLQTPNATGRAASAFRKFQTAVKASEASPF